MKEILAVLFSSFCLVFPAKALTQCAVWNQTTNMIETPSGLIIGVANLAAQRAETLKKTTC